MAIPTQRYYGFRVNNNLADVIDANLALSRINLNIGDLDVIRGSADAGLTQLDLLSVSGLDENIYKTLDRLRGETDRYPSVMENSAGTDITLRGNLNVNGPLAASAIRYRFFNAETESLGLADISTSRVSAWSTSSSTPSESDPIFYGGQLKIKTGGKISVDKITWGEVAQPKIFDAEVPTHKITTTINGETVKLYAMKSIPLKFNGYFRNFNALVSVSAIEGKLVGWRIINLTNASDETRREGNTLNYRSVRGAPRRIEIYYPPQKFTSITLVGGGISSLPEAELTNLTELNLALNQFKDIPDLDTVSPNLNNLTIFRNNLYLAETPSLRKLGLDTVNRLPSSITSLNMYGTYFGSIRCVNRSDQNGSGTIVGTEITTSMGGSDSMSVIEARFPNLVTLNLQRGSGPFFTSDNYDSDCFLPSVPQTCENYYVGSNNFGGIPETGVKDLANLVNINLYNNRRLSDASFSLVSEDLATVNIGNTLLSIPDLSARQFLTSFSYYYGRRPDTLFTGSTDSSYKFSNCTALETLEFRYSAVSGFIPAFKGNKSLFRADFYGAQNLTGGRPSGTDYVLYRDTFNDCKNTLSTFRVLSRSLLEGKGFEPDTFKNLSALSYLYWYSYGRTGAGATIELPDISSCSALRYLIMPVNSFSGSVLGFESNDEIYYVDISRNNLSGGVPNFANKQKLRYLYLYNNQLTSFSGFVNTPDLFFTYLQDNQIAGSIPMLSGQTPRLIRLYIQNNLLDSYTKGSFETLSRIQVIDVSNNNLSESDLNTIIDDLYKNYIAFPRSRVSINLRSQARAVGFDPSAEGTSREQDVRNKLDFLASRGWSISIGG